MLRKRQKAKADANEAAGQAGEDKKDEKATGEDKKDDKKSDEDKKYSEQEYWKNYAEQTVVSTIEFIQNPMVRDRFIDEVKKAKILEHKHRPGMTTLLINYDEKLASECSANPWQRKAPARPAYLELVRAFIEEFGIQVGVLLLYSDHGKGSLERAFAKMVDTAVEPAKASHIL